MEQNIRNLGLYGKSRSRMHTIVDFVLDETDSDDKKIGVLLCEGEDNSIDKAVYSAIFPELVILPMGGCGSVVNTLKKVKKEMAKYEIYAFGIIDRDALSKGERKQLFDEKDVYTTKVPFIENIICCPNVIKYVCESLGLEYEIILEKIQNRLMMALWIKMKDTLPINLGISKEEIIEVLEFGASTSGKTIKKIVDRENILYAYRSKRIVSIIANELHMRNREEYYAKVKQLLTNEKYRSKLVRAMANYVPTLKLYDFEEV